MKARKLNPFFPAPLFLIMMLPALFTMAASEAFAVTASDLIIVYNLNMKESKDVAFYYAKKRQAPKQHIVGVDVPATERMPRWAYEQRLVGPLKEMIKGFVDNKKTPALLLVYGIPLVVEGPALEKADNEFTNLIRQRVEEYKKLVLDMTGDINIIINGGVSRNSKDQSPDMTDSDEGPLDSAEKAIKGAIKYLEDHQSEKGAEPVKQTILSLVIRLSGTSVFVKASMEKMSKLGDKDKVILNDHQFLIQHSILQQELTRQSFKGVLPENALETASRVRLVGGLMGELGFWQELDMQYGKAQTSASVDSELAMITAGPYQLAGWLPNPFCADFDSLPIISEIRAKAIMVGRLDGPTAGMAKRLVDDAVETEKTGLTGTFYIDARGLEQDGKYGGYPWYDKHLIDLAELIKDNKLMNVVLDTGLNLFPEGKCPDAALYCGWYSLGNYVDCFTWKKGAVAFHVASAEASTLKKRESNVWCKRLIEDGVAATLGPVEEPYLTSFPLPDRFFPLLMTGKMPLIEVYFRTVPNLSWRQVLIGDPLYTPFR
ncbi:conserved exported hypothetical protein [uncultured Desulfobacterium sp.]|uniref:TIGR03790 family protein n=1 Tax=uncultured Desulfobacterium sp. TaxID=201089 RepID=A0A445MXY6_9BACT|nr:conserved exported hypothetical protein [uncultured Desulfobacterium sp.]